jgi:DNA adenine methylase
MRSNRKPHEMSDQEHEKLFDLSKTRKAKVAISGYESDMYLDQLSDWYKFDKEVKVYSSPTRKVAKEVLWTNYNPYSGQMELF